MTGQKQFGRVKAWAKKSRRDFRLPDNQFYIQIIHASAQNNELAVCGKTTSSWCLSELTSGQPSL